MVTGLKKMYMRRRSDAQQLENGCLLYPVDVEVPIPEVFYFPWGIFNSILIGTAWNEYLTQALGKCEKIGEMGKKLNFCKTLPINMIKALNKFMKNEQELFFISLDTAKKVFLIFDDFHLPYITTIIIGATPS